MEKDNVLPREGKPMNRNIGLATVILLALAVFLWNTEHQPKEPKQTNKILEAKNNRKSRTGPRNPPKTVLEQEDEYSAPSISDNANEPQPTNKEFEQPETMTAKMEFYLEHLDAIEDPTVADLTYLGELAFEANDPASAYDHYLEVIEGHADDPMAPFALYKFAWVEYNLGQTDAAIEDMNLMIEWIEGSDFPLDQTLRESAHSDLKLFQRRRAEHRSP